MVSPYRTENLRRVYIAEWLDYLHVSQATLADLMGTSEPNVSRWINDQDRLTLHVISGIANALATVSPLMRDAGNLLRPPESVVALDQAREAARKFIEVLPAGEPQNGTDL